MRRVNYKHWLSLYCWTLKEAAFLLNGIDPNDQNTAQAVELGMTQSYHDLKHSMDPYKKIEQTKQQHDSFKRIIQKLERFDWKPEDKPDHEKGCIKVSSIVQAAQTLSIRFPPELIPDEGNNQKSQKAQTEKPSGYFSQEVIAAFDPLPIEGISKLFSLNNVADHNLKTWKKLQNKASENGLKEARVITGGGRRGSTFNPVLVAEWLIKKGKITKQQATRKLRNNIPEHSKDLTEELFEDSHQQGFGL